MRKKKTLPELPKMQLPPRIKPPLMGARLPSFSGDRSACTKCGHKGAKTMYFPAGRSCIHLASSFRVTWGLERLHRICERCHFAWDEACVPAIPVITQHTMVMPAIKDA
jgi:hypothetical protein